MVNNSVNGKSVVFESKYSGQKYPEYGGVKLEDMPEYKRLPIRVRDYASLDPRWYGYTVSIDLDKMINDYMEGYRLPLMAYFRLYPNGKRLVSEYRLNKIFAS